MCELYRKLTPKFIYMKLNTLVLAALTLLGGSTFAKKKQEKPNLIVIHTDEHSFRTLSCYQELLPEDQAFVWGKGNNSKTPNIDRIAHEGAIAMNYYASSPVCTPSRASMVTGLYPQSTGAPKNGMSIREDIPTFATILQEQGYATSYVGKWHLAGHKKYAFDIKYKAGFADNRYMMTGGHAPYFKITNGEIKALGQREGEKAIKDGADNIEYVTDFFTDRTLEILERDKDKPFALMLSIPDPHTPDAAREPYKSMYKDMPVEAPFTMAPEYVSQKPGWGKSTNKDDKNEAKEFDKRSLREYFGMVSCIDDNVGRILKFLDDNDLTDNTIIVFTADHGDMFFEHNRKNKGVPYEASARIPYVMRYPKAIPAGKIIRKAYTNVDFAPTVLGLMGAENKAYFEGIDASTDFTSKTKEVEDDRITYFAKNGGWWVCAVNNRYKLVIDKKEKPWLIDLEKDPFETKNFYNNPEYKEIATNMQKELFVQLKQYKEPGLKTQPYIIK